MEKLCCTLSNVEIQAIIASQIPFHIDNLIRSQLLYFLSVEKQQEKINYGKIN
jgi:hypothetical protein